MAKPGSPNEKWDAEKMRILRRGTRILRQLLRRIPAADLHQLVVTTNEVEYLLELCRLAIQDGWSYRLREKRTKTTRRGSGARQRREKITLVRQIRKLKS